jgi:hypothetical protein
MKRKIAAVAATTGLALALAGPAQADGPYIDRYNEISQNPNPDAQCGSGAGSGAFGYYGPGYNVGQTRQPDPGADGPKTGLSNSAVCGNRPAGVGIPPE